MFDQEFKKIFKLAKDKVDEIEIMLYSGKSFSVNIFKQDVEDFKYSDNNGIGIRIIKDEKVGYSYTEKFDEEDFVTIINGAVENSKIIESEDKVIMDNYPNLDQELDIYSEKLKDLSIEEKIDFAKKVESCAYETDKRVINVNYCGLGDSSSFFRIANSKGLDKSYQSNSMYCYVAVLAGNEEEKKSGMAVRITRDFSELNYKDIAEEAVNKAVSLLNGKEVESGSYPVIFNNEMSATLLQTFAGIFSGKTVQEGGSLLKGKIGKDIANEKVTIVDNGILQGGMATSPFDSEGYPCQKTILVENGKLKSFLHNTQTALKDNTESTGNAARGYKSALSVATSNFILEKGDFTKKDLQETNEKAIEIVSLAGLHSGANSISGDFSLSGDGFLIENGKRKHALKNFTVSGNYLELLKDIEKIANDFKFNMNSVGAASILVKKLNISF